MENKLKELTDRLYGEGLEKGRLEAEELKKAAKAEAEKIVAEAKAEAAQIVKDAEKKALDVEKNSMTEISLAGKQALAKLKVEIAELVVAKTLDANLKGAMLDAEFVKSLLLQAVSSWNVNSSKVELKAILPAEFEKELSAKFAAASSELLSKGVEVCYSEDVKSGFKLGEKNGGYYISFSDESFKALIGEYLREKVSELLFA